VSSSAGSIHQTAKIDPSARIDPAAVIGPNVTVGQDVIIGPHCSIGAGTTLRPRCIIVQHTTIGEANDIHPYAVIGGDPQDKSYDPARPGETIIGDRNIIREHVTISRSNWNGGPTRIGSGCYIMALAHIGHNAQIGDNCILANTASLAGHARLGNGCVMSGGTGIHQFTTVGDGVMFRGGAMVSMHVPPFVVVMSGNCIGGLNKVGLMRNPALNSNDRIEIKEAFRAIYRTRAATPMAELLTELRARQWGPGATRFLDFIADALAQEPPRRRGVCGGRKQRSRGAISDPVD
jgi:UDP-N-acetylglucosamine acyltransferase